MTRQIKGYDQLSAAERFRLALKAMARGDDAEIGRLQRASEWTPYRLRDIAEAIQDAQTLTLTFAIDLVSKLSMVRVMTATADAVPVIQPAVIEVRDYVRAECVDMMAGFDAMCQEHMGIDGKTVLGAFMPPVLGQYQELAGYWPEAKAGDPNCEYGAGLMESVRVANVSWPAY